MASENEIAAARFQGRHVCPDREEALDLAIVLMGMARGVVAQPPVMTGEYRRPETCILKQWRCLMKNFVDRASPAGFAAIVKEAEGAER
jgi:hypothetical protein